MNDMVELVWKDLQGQLDDLKKRVQIAQQTEQALFTDSIPAFTVVNLPTLANGGLGNGTSYVTLAFASNGRKAAEGVGAGTGQLVYYNAPTDQWLRVRDDSLITA